MGEYDRALISMDQDGRVLEIEHKVMAVLINK